MKSCGICPFPSAFVSLSLLTSRSIHVVTDGKISSSFYGWVADWVTSLSLFTFMHWRRKWQPAPVFLPGESRGRGSLVAAVYGVAQSRTRRKRLSSSTAQQQQQQSVVCVCISYLYPFIYWWTFGLFLYLGCCKQHHDEHRSAYIVLH